MLPSDADQVVLSQDDIRERLQQTDGTLAYILNQGKIGRGSQEWTHDVRRDGTGLSSNEGTAPGQQLVYNFSHQESFQAHSSVNGTLDQKYLSLIQESSAKELGRGDGHGKASAKQSEPELAREQPEKRQPSAVLEDARQSLRRSTLEQKYSPVLQNRRRAQSNNQRPNAVYGARPQSSPGRNDSVSKHSASGRSKGSNIGNRREARAAVDGGHYRSGSSAGGEGPSGGPTGPGSLADSSTNRIARVNALNEQARSKHGSSSKQRAKSAQSRDSQKAAGRRQSAKKVASRTSTRSPNRMVQSQQSRGMRIQTSENENLRVGPSQI